MILLETWGFDLVYGFLSVVVAHASTKSFNAMSQDFLLSRYFDSETESARFVVVYNLQIHVIQTCAAFLVGAFYFQWADFVFGASGWNVFYWASVGVTLNARWLLEHFFRVEFDNFNLDKNFAYKMVSVVFAFFFIHVLEVDQTVTKVEWVAYFILLLSALYINSLQTEVQQQSADIEQARYSFNSANM